MNGGGDIPVRLGRNQNGYHGEPIAIWDVLTELETLAPISGWERFPLNLPPDAWLPAYRKISDPAFPNIYISAGIHGDEPAGPLAVRELIAASLLPAGFNYWIIPCLNPDGFERNTRENEAGIDLNRDYTQQVSPRVRAHVRWLSELPRLDLALLLHEDWESNGFYLYELNPENFPSLAEVMLQAVRGGCPIESSGLIDGREATAGMIRFVGHVPHREDWPEALWLIQHKTRHNYTLEAPSDFELPVRVRALSAAVVAALSTLATASQGR